VGLIGETDDARSAQAAAAVVEAPPRRAALTERRRDVLAVAIVALVFLVPLRGLLRAQGPPMEEGFMLVFPERVLAGDIPNRDFLHLYGPGSLWALAGTFKVFGVSLLTERLFGLVQQLAVVYGVFALARRWGRILAVACALTSALILVPFGLTALAWVGGLGLALWGLVAGLAALRSSDEQHARRGALLAGVLFGAALLFRLDLVVAITLALLALARHAPRSLVLRVGVGLAAGLSPYVIHLATAGPGNVVQGMIIDPVFNLRGGRSLPIPPPWSHLDGFLQRAGALAQLSWPIPSLSLSQQLFVWFFLLLGSVLVLGLVAWRSIRHQPASPRALALVVIACFSAGLVPQAIQRVDSAHLAWVGCVPIAFLPIAAFEATRRRFRVAHVRRVAIASATGTLALVLVAIPGFTASVYTDYSAQTFGVHRSAHRIEHDGRVFYYGKPDRAAAANLVIAEAARISEPGDRLFVGPANLRRTPYSDAYLYYMLPELDPATYYIEMDPGVANAEDSGLAEDLASADIAILSSIWDDWSEPNDSRLDGSTESEEVLARDFCLVGEYLDRYELYRRCR
jgi:hypothetical protein